MFDTSGQPRGRGIVRAPGPWLLIVLLASLAMPSLAQDGTGPAPESAQDRRHGSGWDCDPGHRIADGTCVALDMPANAYPTGRSYGTGRACLHGYREVRGASCEAVAIVANAFLDASGLSWNRDRGYRKQADACALIEVPENAYLADRGIGAGWECDRAYGPGWRCARGYEARKTSCITIDLPENAHLDRSGNRWQCNRGFPAFGGQPMHHHTLRAPTRQRGAGRIGSC